MLRVTFTIPNDTPVVELWDDDTSKRTLEGRAIYHKALHYDYAWEVPDATHGNGAVADVPCWGVGRVVPVRADDGGA